MDVFREFGFPGAVVGVLLWELWQNTLALRGIATAVARLEGFLAGTLKGRHE